MWNLKRNDTNSKTHRLRNKLMAGEDGGRVKGRHSFGVWDGHVHSAIFKIKDN